MQLELVDEVAVLRIDTGKANALNSESLEQIAGQVATAAAKARALVLTGTERFFSAGLDLPTVLTFERAAMQSFMGQFAEAMLGIFACPIPVVAAVNGHAIAGGCVLAMQADYRVMVNAGAKIGLSEAALGIGLPAEVIETLAAQVPASSLLPIALEGRLFDGDEALRLGLVQEVVAPTQLEVRALAKAKELAAVPTLAYRQIKSALRTPAVERSRVRRGETLNGWLTSWYSDEAQKRLKDAVARLQKR